MISTLADRRPRAMKKQARKAGRPPKPKGEALNIAMEVRFTEQQRDVIDQAVGMAGRTRSEFIRDAAVAAAEKIVGRAD